MENAVKTVIQVPIERELVARLDQEARRQEVSRAALIRTACLRYLRERDREERARQYEAGYARSPDETNERDSLAWLAAAELPSEEWPEAPVREG